MDNSTPKPDLQKAFYTKALDKIPNWLKNKYLIAFLAFATVLFFFDDNNVFLQFQRRARLNELNLNEKHLTEKIVTTKKELNLLKTSAETIEKYAREQYLMKKDNEDIFIISTEKK